MTEKKSIRRGRIVHLAFGQPQLIGGRCKVCNTYYFPKSFVRHKPDCKDRSATEDVLLSRKGKLYSYTVQYVPSLRRP